MNASLAKVKSLPLLEKRKHYKPFAYPWTFEAYLKMRKMDWGPWEVPLDKDVYDWNNNLTDAERNLLTQLFRFFTQADCDINSGYHGRYIPAFPHPEITMMLGAFATAEANHMHAYSQLLDTVGMPETEYQAFHEFEEMQAKHDYLFAQRKGGDEVENLALDLAVFSAFGEGMQLFSSFAILMSFQRRKLMKGMSTIIEWSIRDEAHHVESMIELFHVLIAENPSIWTDAFKALIYQTCRDMVELEDRFIDLAFEMGDIEGITVDECKLYIRYIADRRLLQLGLKANYGVTENPFDWLDWLMNAETHTNFFEGRATAYTKGGVINWDKAFSSIDGPPKEEEKITRLVVYGKQDCPYCHLVKDSLARIDVDFTYISLDDEAKRREFYDRSGTNSVPQLYLTTRESSDAIPQGEALGGWDKFGEAVDKIKKSVRPVPV